MTTPDNAPDLIARLLDVLATNPTPGRSSWLAYFVQELDQALGSEALEELLSAIADYREEPPA